MFDSSVSYCASILTLVPVPHLFSSPDVTVCAVLRMSAIEYAVSVAIPFSSRSFRIEFVPVAFETESFSFAVFVSSVPCDVCGSRFVPLCATTAVSGSVQLLYALFTAAIFEKSSPADAVIAVPIAGATHAYA